PGPVLPYRHRKPNRRAPSRVVSVAEYNNGRRLQAGGGGAMALDERTAISQMQRGDIRGLDALMLAYQVRAIRAAHLVTHDLPLAEDIVQSAFIRAFERIGQYDDSRPFGPWFLRSVINSATTAVSRRGRFERRVRPTSDD